MAFFARLSNKKAANTLLERNSVSSRIIFAGFETKFHKTTIIEVYAPKNNKDKEE